MSECGQKPTVGSASRGACTLTVRQATIGFPASYAFGLKHEVQLFVQHFTPAAAVPKPAEKLAEYSYNEFFLDLPEHWRQVATSNDNTLNWHSEVDGATITVSCDFYEVPDSKALGLAEVCLDGRHKAMEGLAPGQVSVLSRSIKPYSGGGGLEMSYSAQIPGSTYLYLGYVTARKIFNFGLTCGPDKFAAADLYNLIMSGRLRVKLP